MGKYKRKKKKILIHHQSINKKLVVLLGAGAAIPWGGPQSSDLLQLFKDDATYKTIEQDNLGKYLCDEVLNKIADVNFESMIAALEEIFEYVIAKHNPDRHIFRTPVHTAISELIEEIYPKIFLNMGEVEDEVQYAYNILKHYIDIVTEKIDDYNCRVSEYPQNQLLINFVRELLCDNFSVKFYTLNYDSMIPQILSKQFQIEEGMFPLDYFHGFNITSMNKLQTAKLSHINLHGSIFLAHSDVEWNPRGELLYFKERQPMPDYIKAMEFGKSSGMLVSVPIITGYNKTQRMINKPFNWAFNTFMNDLKDCNRFLSVGYSYSDPHMNSMICSFLNWNQIKYVHINNFVNNRQFDYNEYDEDRYLNQIVSSSSFDDDNYLSEDKADDQWVYDKEGKVRVFKKGFEAFLSDKKNWKYLINK